MIGFSLYMPIQAHAPRLLVLHIVGSSVFVLFQCAYQIITDSGGQ